MVVRFDESDRVRDDPCAQQVRNEENAALSYYLTGGRIAPHVPSDGGIIPEKKNKAQAASAAGLDCAATTNAREFAAHTRNLRPWTGYGVSQCKVDESSHLRNDQIWTNVPWKTQLDTRTFVAVPNLVRGPPRPVTEAKVQSGQDTWATRRCEPLAEKAFPVFNPAVLPVCVSHIIPPWTRGGASSREINRSPEFMRSLGFRHDGRAWVRTC